MIPIGGLIMIMFLRESLMSNVDAFMNLSVASPIPYFFGVPLKAVS